MPETDSRAVPTTGWAQTGAPAHAPPGRYLRRHQRPPPSSGGMVDSCAFGVPLPRAQSAGEKELPGAGSGLGEDGLEMVAGGVFGHHHPLGDLAGVEALAEQSQYFGLASGQSAGPGVDV